MARPKSDHARMCITCRSTKPRSEWRRHKARGQCDTHYRAWLRTRPMCKYEGCKVRIGLTSKDSRQGFCRWHDHLLLKEPHRSPESIAFTLESFLSRVKGCPVEGCWIWSGRTLGRYPVISVDGQDWLAHRFSYNFFIGGHRPGHTLDHVCRRTMCVRPDHLLPMTLLSNVRREQDGREWTPYETAEALLLIPQMPAAVMDLARQQGLPIGRAKPGMPFSFGLDGTPILLDPLPMKFPTIRQLSKV